MRKSLPQSQLQTQSHFKTLQNHQPDAMTQQQLHAAMLTIDISTRITDCNVSAMDLLCQHELKDSGRHLAEVIPQLPFATNTPFYNLAYAVFHAKDQPIASVAVAQDGTTIPIDIKVSKIIRKGRHLISLTIDSPENLTVNTASTRSQSSTMNKLSCNALSQESS